MLYYMAIALQINHWLTDVVVEHPDGELEGVLVRKHEWESTTKKASNRWETSSECWE